MPACVASTRIGLGAPAALTTAVFCLVILLTSAAASAQDKRILLLFDEDTTLPGLAILDQSLRTTFTAGLGPRVQFFTESMEISQFTDEQYEQVLREHYSKKYRSVKLDLVVAVMGPALHFLLRHGDAAFPGVPVVFAGVDADDLQGVTLPAHVTGLLVKRVFAPTLDVVLGLQPGTRHVAVVGGTSPFDRHLLQQARRELSAFEGRVSFEYLTDLPIADLTAVVSQLPAHSVILFVNLFRDGAGRAFVPHDVVARLADAANVPVYVFLDQYLGRGAVGGHLYRNGQHGQSAAELGLRVLRGERPASIPVRELQSTANMFDARQLARWRISERRLPPGSEIRFRGPSLWRDYRRETLAALGVLVVQLVMISALLYQRRARQRAEVELTAIIDSSDDAIVSKDLSSTIMSWNRGAERIFGYTTQEMIGRSIRTIIPEDRLSEEEEVLRKIRRGERVSHFETARRRKDGSEVHVSLTISPIYSNAGVIVGASKIARDISDRKRAELESRRNLALAADANRRVTMTTLAGSIAHDLGQPLHGILQNAQAGEMLIASERATPEKLRAILADICTADLRATQIIERHRRMLRSHQLDTKAIDLHAVVCDSVALVADSIRSKQIQVDVELPPGPCFVVGDPVLLQQVVVNLVMNAMDAVADTPLERRRITLQNTITSGNVELSVRDAGTGLPAGVDGKLFEPFVTTKANGMGIGLTIAHTIVEAHRGRIAARNNPETGATFTVSLPCAEAP